MDYAAAGNSISSGKQPKHKVGKKGLGAEKSPRGGKASKEELLARMKFFCDRMDTNLSVRREDLASFRFEAETPSK